jgi:hypothetical protein
MNDVPGESVLSSLTLGPIEQTADGVGQALLVRVRAGRNKDFDRLVFDFEGPVLGMRMVHVNELVEDGAGNPIPLRGRAVVQIVIRPVAAHRYDGSPTLSGPLPDLTGFAAFRQIADAGDSEAVLTWGIGVAARTGSHGFTLTGPSRVASTVVHAESGTGNQLLRRGDSGAAVATWQLRLVQTLSRGLAVDEQFGPITEQAIRDFQRNNGLGFDGIIDPTRAPRWCGPRPLMHGSDAGRQVARLRHDGGSPPGRRSRPCIARHGLFGGEVVLLSVSNPRRPNGVRWLHSRAARFSS